MELQAILSQNAGGGCAGSFFWGVSPPVRSGWAGGAAIGGAANPIAHDNTWARAAYSASHTNLQALREIESNGVSFLRGDLLKLGSTPPDARMSWNPEALFSHPSAHHHLPPCPAPSCPPSSALSSCSMIRMAPSSPPMMMAVDGPHHSGQGEGGFADGSHRNFDFPSSGTGYGDDLKTLGNRNINGGGDDGAGVGDGANHTGSAPSPAPGVLPFSCRTEYFFK